MNDLTRKITHQLMTQPHGQEVTVTFADGTTFTTRYTGSKIRSHTTKDRTAHDVCIQLLVQPNAEITNVCGAVRTPDQWEEDFPFARGCDADDYPCVLRDGHTRGHVDQSGDEW